MNTIIGVWKISYLPTGEFYLGVSKDCEGRWKRLVPEILKHHRISKTWSWEEDRPLEDFKFDILVQSDDIDHLYTLGAKMIDEETSPLMKNTKDKNSRGWNVGKKSLSPVTPDEIIHDFKQRMANSGGIPQKGFEYIHCDRLPETVEILADDEFIPLKGILCNSAEASSKMTEVLYTDRDGHQRTIQLTIDHPVHTAADERKFVKDLELTDGLLDSETLEALPIIAVVPSKYKEPTFDVETDTDIFDLSGILSHNCRTANGYDIWAEEIGANPQMKDGRGNICPATIILPTIAMEAKIQSEETGDDLKETFMTMLDQKIHECKDQLIERFEYICSRPKEASRFMWIDNPYMIFGYDPDSPEGIRSGLKHGTLAVGQLGLAECLQILIGKDHTTEEGMEFAKEIEGMFKSRCAKFKEVYKLNIGVYMTPAENLCYKAMQVFRKRFGVIPNVSDREYFTNSIHVPVWHKMSPFEKIDIESQLTGYSNAGCITYVELDSGVRHNLKALEEIVRYGMDKDVPYLAINVPSDCCDECGYCGEEFGECCPKCGSKNIKRIRRVTGYLTGDYLTTFNKGKVAEVKDRVKHMTFDNLEDLSSED